MCACVLGTKDGPHTPGGSKRLLRVRAERLASKREIVVSPRFVFFRRQGETRGETSGGVRRGFPGASKSELSFLKFSGHASLFLCRLVSRKQSKKFCVVPSDQDKKKKNHATLLLSCPCLIYRCNSGIHEKTNLALHSGMRSAHHAAVRQRSRLPRKDSRPTIVS